jgi:hypothetical protein
MLKSGGPRETIEHRGVCKKCGVNITVSVHSKTGKKSDRYYMPEKDGDSLPVEAPDTDSD